MQTIWVTGGAGFIGSHLCEELLGKHFRVICLDNLITGSEENLNSFLSNPQFTFLHQDITNFPLIEAKKLPKPDFIFHLASPASPNKYSKTSYVQFPIETLLVNSEGTNNLLNVAKSSGARFLFASTSEIYGDPQVSPQSENYFGNVNPIGIRSVYDESKRFGEALTMAYFRKHKIDVRIARIFNTFGPRLKEEDGRVVSNFILQALYNEPITIYGNGEQTRSFCYITDMVRGLYSLMFTDAAKSEVVNLGNPDEQKIIELARIIIEVTGSRSKLKFEELPEDDPKKRKPDITKAKKLLQWSPEISLEAGLKNTIRYFSESNK